MQVWVRQQASDLYLETGRQIEDLHRTWTHDTRARLWVWCAVAAGVSVIVLAVSVDMLRFLDLHHYRARFLSLTTDRGLPELVMDALVVTATVLTAQMFVRTGLRSFLLVSVLLCLVALDDFFSFHESLGTYLVDHLGIPDFGNFKGQALGELVFLVTFGLVCIPFFLWAAWGMEPRNLAVLVIYGLAFTVFAGFSGGVDFLHSLAQSSFMDRLMGWIEESGEILVVTGITSVAILQSHSSLGS